MRDRVRLDPASALIARTAAIDLRVQPLVAQSPMRLPTRQKIWELQGGLQCSIVGTCLSDEDLLAIGQGKGVVPQICKTLSVLAVGRRVVFRARSSVIDGGRRLGSLMSF